MGAWGPAVFSDDTACDVRDEWRALLGDGLSAPEATDRLLGEWKESVDDPDDGPVFWLALAATQWKAGHLEKRVKDRALEIIEDGSNLERWREDAGLLRKRTAVLDKLHEQLTSPQPAAKKIRKVRKATCEWERGEVIAFRLRSGKFVLFRVVSLVTDKGGTYPDCEFYDWIGDAIPSEAQIRSLPRRTGTAMIAGATQRGYPADRLIRTGVQISLEEARPAFGVGVWAWSELDKLLEEKWGYR